MTIVIVIILVTFIMPVALASFFLLRKGRQQAINLHSPNALLSDRYYDISIYEYGPDVQCIDDITATRMQIYRDSGRITGYGIEGGPIFDQLLHPNENSIYEFGSILISAKEVKRLSDHQTIYFFEQLKPLRIKHTLVHKIYTIVQYKLAAGRHILMIVTKVDTHEATTFENQP